MNTAKYHASSSTKYYHQVKDALKELGIKHGPFRRGLLNNWTMLHFYDLYESQSMPFLILKLGDTDFTVTEIT